MQNLCLFKTRTVPLPDLTGERAVRRCAIDADKQTVYLLTSDSIYALTLEDDRYTSIYSTPDPATTIEDLSFLSELNHLCLGLSNGDLFSLQLDDDTEENLNVIGTLEERIHELKSSPDQQILLAATGTKVLLLSSSNDYEPIAETSLDTEDFGEQAFVNVGWGSKTTQFHGSAGKKAALESTAVAPVKARSDQDDDGRSRIVWRDDGDLFAVSFISSSKQWRTVKIFNKQGQLQATNEPSLNGCIESALGWKITGELIGVATRLNNGQKLTISFLEKNGLKHGELLLESIGDVQQKVEHLLWNKDSSILAVVLRRDSDSHLQLWSSSNYHWYLKQSLPFPSTSIQTLHWDVDMANKLHLTTSDGRYCSLSWHWTNQVSYTNDRSLVFLIDGRRLRVSNFTQSSIPPPMSSYEILCPTEILALASDDDRDQLVLLLADRSIAVCSSSPSSDVADYRTVSHLSEIKSTHHVTSVILPSDSPVTNIHHVTHVRLLDQQMYFIEDKQLHIYDLAKKTKQSLPLNFQCLTTAIDQDQPRHVCFQDEQGKIYRLEKNEFHPRMHFPRACSHFSALANGQYVGLTENFRLYSNTDELAHNCNSYFIHDRTILVYSTLQHQLAFRSLINGQTVAETSMRRTGKRI